MDVAGARFFDGIQGKGHDVAVAVQGGQALIRSADGRVDVHWPLFGLRALQTPDATVAFRRGRGAARLIVSDPALLRMLCPALRRRPRSQAGWRTAVVACLGMLGMAVVTVDQAPGLLAPLVPLSWEEAWGATLQRVLVTQGARCTGADGQAALDALTTRLATAGGIAGPVHVAVLDSKLVNAFTLPGNRVLVMRGLITQARDGNELAGVLAHELGHVKHRDATRQVLRQLGLSAIAASLGWGDHSGGGLAATLVGLSYGRSAEAAADAFALQTLHVSGLRADGLAAFFVHLQTKEGGTSLGFLSDHPPTADRLVRARQPADGVSALDDAQWRAIGLICEKPP